MPEAVRMLPLMHDPANCRSPDNILHNEALNKAIAVLPVNYNFEVSGCHLSAA